MKLTFALDRHIPVEDIVDDILDQLEDAGIELGRDDLLPQNITLEEALAMHVGDVLHYEVSLPTEIPGTSSLDILAVVVQRSFEKHTADKEAEFQLMIRPDMIIPYGPITASVEERDAQASPVDASCCDIFLLDDDGRKHPEMCTTMVIDKLPEVGTLIRIPPEYLEALTKKAEQAGTSIDELYQVQMANLIDPARLTEHGINLTVSQVLNSYTAGRAEIWLTAIDK